MELRLNATDNMLAGASAQQAVMTAVVHVAVAPW